MNFSTADAVLLSWWQKASFVCESHDTETEEKMEAARILVTEARNLATANGQQNHLLWREWENMYDSLRSEAPSTASHCWSSTLSVEKALHLPEIRILKNAQPCHRKSAPSYPVPSNQGPQSGSESYGQAHLQQNRPSMDLHNLASEPRGPVTLPTKRRQPIDSDSTHSAGYIAFSRPMSNGSVEPSSKRNTTYGLCDGNNEASRRSDSDCSAFGHAIPNGKAGPWSASGDGCREEEGHDNTRAFITARHQLLIDQQTKQTSRRYGQGGSSNSYVYGSGKKSLGTRRGPCSQFVPPIARPADEGNGRSNSAASSRFAPTSDFDGDERLKNIDQKMIELIRNEIMDHGPSVQWDDIAGLEFAKKTIQEIVVWPMLRPDIFTGLRGPPKGMLLFGPPGTGKTLIGKCIASQAHATFFSISASSLTSKWVGEGEKMVRALFAVARCHQPAVIFIDEIDSLLSQRSDTEHESSRRIKTEFLVQLDGATVNSDCEDRLLVVGATNRPQEIDEAARRRLVKRLYIPLPEADARKQIVQHLMSEQRHSVSEEQLADICQRTDGYSGADMSQLCREAALGPIRSIHSADIQHIMVDQVRSISYEDFIDALRHVRPSVSGSDLHVYVEWNNRFGCGV